MGFEDVYRSLKVKDNLYVGGDLTIIGGITLTGGLTIGGDITLGDAATDTLTVNAAAIFNSTLLLQDSLTVNENVASSMGSLSVTYLLINGTADNPLNMSGATVNVGGADILLTNNAKIDNTVNGTLKLETTSAGYVSISAGQTTIKSDYLDLELGTGLRFTGAGGNVDGAVTFRDAVTVGRSGAEVAHQLYGYMQIQGTADYGIRFYGAGSTFASAIDIEDGAAATGITIGTCSSYGINITGTEIPIGIHYNVDMTTQVGSNVEGIKIILERTADVVVGTSNVLGAEFIIKQGDDSYAAGMAPQITGVRIAMGGANTKATVVGLKCETQSNGYVDYMAIFSVNSGGAIASGGANTYIRSYVACPKMLKLEQPAANTCDDLIYMTDNVGTGTITNLITINARNSTNLLDFEYAAGCIAADTSNPSGTYSHRIAVNVQGAGTRFIKLSTQ